MKADNYCLLLEQMKHYKNGLTKAKVHSAGCCTKYTECKNFKKGKLWVVVPTLSIIHFFKKGIVHRDLVMLSNYSFFDRFVKWRRS